MPQAFTDAQQAAATANDALTLTFADVSHIFPGMTGWLNATGQPAVRVRVREVDTTGKKVSFTNADKQDSVAVDLTNYTLANVAKVFFHAQSVWVPFTPTREV
jgi:hypothetical protein